MTALQYNKHRASAGNYPQSSAFITAAQRTIGSESPSGAWRCSDTKLIKDFQRRCGLRRGDIDGKVGPQTERLIRHKSNIMKGVAQEVWWDHGPIERVGALKAMGVSALSIICNRSGDGGPRSTGPVWKHTGEIERVAAAANKRGMAVGLTVWVRPKKNYIDAVFDRLAVLVPSTGAASIEFDLEGCWKKYSLDDSFESMVEAGAYLVARAKAFAKKHGVFLEMTTYPGHDEWRPSLATASPHMDVVWFQFYSSFKKDKPRQAWHGKDAAGRRQRREIPKFRARFPDHPPVAGLCVFGQRWPGVSAVDAMEIGLFESALQGIRKVRYWSAKHFQNGAAGDFLAGVKNGRVE